MDSESEPIKDNTNCPRCQKGYLVIRENNFVKNKLLGCSNYPFCELTFKQFEIINDHIKCPSCGGYMTKRSGQYGQFYGCTNYPYCNQTVKIGSSYKGNSNNSR